MAKRRERMWKEWKHRQWKRLRAKSIFNLHTINFLSFIALSLTRLFSLSLFIQEPRKALQNMNWKRLSVWFNGTLVYLVSTCVCIIDRRHGRGMALSYSHTQTQKPMRAIFVFFVLLCTAMERSSLRIPITYLRIHHPPIQKRRNNNRIGKHDLHAYLLLLLPKSKHTIIIIICVYQFTLRATEEKKRKK